jgi:hypothetical protein
MASETTPLHPELRVDRRLLVGVTAAALALLVLIPIGRWEAGRRAAEENEGMRAILAEVGPLDSPTLQTYRHLVGFDCLVYTRDGHPFGLEICVDHQGRLIEAIDRRNPADPTIWSLRDDPGRAEVRLDRARVLELVRREKAEEQ